MAKHAMNKIEDYYTLYCIECESLCHLYEQGLTCNCGNPWENEYMYEKDYPKKWINVRVYIYKKEKFIKNFDRFTFTFGKYEGVKMPFVLANDPQYILWCHTQQGWFDWFNLQEGDLRKVHKAINEIGK
jgi:hypothetical protein